MSNNGAAAVSLAIGNTYQRLSNYESNLSRDSRHKKIHDWTLYVDVIENGDDETNQTAAETIQNVLFELHPTFSPNKFTCACPIRVKVNGTSVSRFSTRQQSYGGFEATIHILGRGGTKMSVTHNLVFQRGGDRQPRPIRFVEARGLHKPLRMIKLSEDLTFGIELELSTTGSHSREDVANTVQSGAGVAVKVVRDYSEAHDPFAGWKVVHDGSIACSRTNPDCVKFELVSPVLRGGTGLNQVRNVTKALNSVASDVNKSMGFHVHVGVIGMHLKDLVKLCQNFIKYEDAMDALMSPSRRTGGTQSDTYIKSNKEFIVLGGMSSNYERHKELETCQTIDELCDIMCPHDRYYKLNLRNLSPNTGLTVQSNVHHVRNYKPTVEFRQHSATTNYTKIAAWVRFCVAMVQNSAKYPSPKALRESRGVKEQSEFLFEYVIKDRALKNAFVTRRLQIEEQAAACCDSCAPGSSCSSSSHSHKRIKGYFF